MNLFKHLLAVFALAAGALLPVSGFAQVAADHSHDHTPVAPSAAMTDGDVKKVDRDASKVTIKHGDIKHLDMPGMTMVFTVKDKGLLAAVKPGDKIQFMVVREGGKLVVTDIQPLR